MKHTEKECQKLYLEWFNNYLSTGLFAEHYQLEITELENILDVGRKYNELMKFKITEQTELRSYYMNKYKSDEMGKDIKQGLTFYDLFRCLDSYNCVYDLTNVHDSIIRERLFTALCKVMDCDYDYIYTQWLKTNK